jgi:hypothetical protein
MKDGEREILRDGSGRSGVGDVDLDLLPFLDALRGLGGDLARHAHATLADKAREEITRILRKELAERTVETASALGGCDLGHSRFAHGREVYEGGQ